MSWHEVPRLLVTDFALLVVLLTCLFTDIKWKRIPNWITLPGMGLGLGLNTLLWGWAGLKQSGLGLLVGFGLLFILFLLGWMGGGDVKLMGAVGAIGGFPFVVAALVYSILVGAFIGFVVLIWKRELLRSLKNIFLYMLSRVLRFMPKHELTEAAMHKIPFGIAIVIGVVWARAMSWFADPLWMFR